MCLESHAVLGADAGVELVEALAHRVEHAAPSGAQALERGRVFHVEIGEQTIERRQGIVLRLDRVVDARGERRGDQSHGTSTHGQVDRAVHRVLPDPVRDDLLDRRSGGEHVVVLVGRLLRVGKQRAVRGDVRRQRLTREQGVGRRRVPIRVGVERHDHVVEAGHDDHVFGQRIARRGVEGRQRLKDLRELVAAAGSVRNPRVHDHPLRVIERDHPLGDVAARARRRFTREQLEEGKSHDGPACAAQHVAPGEAPAIAPHYSASTRRKRKPSVWVKATSNSCRS